MYGLRTMRTKVRSESIMGRAETMMRTTIQSTMFLIAALALILCAPQSAFAYAGPGSGLTVIGAAVSFIGSVFLVIVGFIWYPIKRLLKGKKSRRP